MEIFKFLISRIILTVFEHQDLLKFIKKCETNINNKLKNGTGQKVLIKKFKKPPTNLTA